MSVAAGQTMTKSTSRSIRHNSFIATCWKMEPFALVRVSVRQTLSTRTARSRRVRRLRDFWEGPGLHLIGRPLWSTTEDSPIARRTYLWNCPQISNLFRIPFEFETLSSVTQFWFRTIRLDCAVPVISGSRRKRQFWSRRIPAARMLATAA